MKYAGLAILSLATAVPALAQNDRPVDEILGYPREIGNVVQNYAEDGLTEACAHPKIKEVIDAFESGETHYLDFQSDETVTKGWETFAPDGGFMECPVPEPKKTGDYCWKWLSDPVEVSDEQLPFGVSVRMAPADSRPHYHAQRECFYIFEGETLLNVDGKYEKIEAGSVVDSGPNAIHNWIVVKPGTYAQMYWFPQDGNFETFVYGRRDNTASPISQEVWDRLDGMRAAEGIAAWGTTPAIQWWEENRTE